MSPFPTKSELPKIIHRLKTRLALAKFKHQHGYERLDLMTLELSLLKTRHPLLSFSSSSSSSFSSSFSSIATAAATAAMATAAMATATTSPSPYHRYYPTHRTHLSPITKPTSFVHAMLPTRIRSPLSAKRNTSPRTPLCSLSSDDQDAAHLLVMLHRTTSPC